MFLRVAEKFEFLLFILRMNCAKLFYYFPGYVYYEIIVHIIILGY